MKRKHAMFKNKDKDSDSIDEEVFKEVAGVVINDIKEKATERRVIIRKETGEIAFEVPMFVGIAIVTAFTIFLFPAVVIALIVGYHRNLRVEVIREISGDELEIAEKLEQQHTHHGIRYEAGDGQSTVIQS